MTHAEQSLIQRKLEWAAEHRVRTRIKHENDARLRELDEMMKAFAK